MAVSIRLGASFGAIAFILAAASPGIAQTSWGVSVNLGNAPPPPVVVVREEPRVVMVPGSTVYVVDDDRYAYDCFRSGVYWYAWNDGYWYRSRAWRGPFTAVESRSVPRAILIVPQKHWKHHPHGGRAGLAKRQHDRDEIRLASEPPSRVMVVKGRSGKHKGRDH